MAQLRQDYAQFQQLNSGVLVIVPNGFRMIERHVKKHQTPYPILSDKGAKVAKRYFQDQLFFKMGKPSVFLVNTDGRILYALYASSYLDEPDNNEPLAVLQQRL